MEEAIESAAIQSVNGSFRVETFGVRPVRCPHHTASAVALVGGGGNPRPGEISLAHHGVLFLDELPEFERKVLEALREPLESGRVTISRAARQADFPARFHLVAAMNPCPCGYLGHFSGKCRCTPDQVARYRSRISGPLLDRIDLHVHVPPVDVQALCEPRPTESRSETRDVRSRVVRAREIQRKRYEQGRVGQPTNGGLSLRELRDVARPDEAGDRLLARAVESLGLSARAYVRVLRVARTIADLDDSRNVSAAHLSEAVRCRLLDHAQLPGTTA